MKALCDVVKCFVTYGMQDVGLAKPQACILGTFKSPQRKDLSRGGLHHPQRSMIGLGL